MCTQNWDFSQGSGRLILPQASAGRAAGLGSRRSTAGIIVLLNRNKPAERRGKVILINPSGEFQKGRPKNFISDESVKKIAAAFHAGKDVERFVKVIGIEEIAKHDYNLSPSRHIEVGAATEHRDVQTILDELVRQHCARLSAASLMPCTRRRSSFLGPLRWVRWDRIATSTFWWSRAARTIRRRLIGIPIPIDVIVATPEDLEHHAVKIGVQPKRVQLQRMTKKWASCSPGGRICFSTDLLTEDAPFRELVIVHELLHLQVPNHGKLFKSLLGAYVPNWESRVKGRFRKLCGYGVVGALPRARSVAD